MVAGAWETHPRTLNQQYSASDHFVDPREVVRARTPAPRALGDLRPLTPGTDLPAAQTRLMAEMRAARVPAAAARDLLIAAGEVLHNAHRYGGGVRAWRAGSAGARFVCEITDDGPGLDDPLAGYLPPRPGHGAGLSVARQLTRRLEMTSTDRGLTTRLWV